MQGHVPPPSRVLSGLFILSLLIAQRGTTIFLRSGYSDKANGNSLEQYPQVTFGVVWNENLNVPNAAVSFLFHLS